MPRSWMAEDLTAPLPVVHPDATRLLPTVTPTGGSGETGTPGTPRGSDDAAQAGGSGIPDGPATPDGAAQAGGSGSPGRRYRSVHAELTRRSIANTARALSRAVGEGLITFGLVVLLFAAYEVWGHTTLIHNQQARLNGQLAQAWAAPTGVPSAAAPTASAPDLPVPPGGAIGRLYIPKLHLHWVVVEGVTLADLRYAPGHYPGTAMPGRIGNFAVAGHREPGIFWDLDRVGPGDSLIVETQTNWYVYQVYENHIVTPHSMEVVAPAPNQPGVAPTEADMTLTTCNPKWDNYQRMAVHATLQVTLPHEQRPSELSEG